MRITIDAAGRVVIPKVLREQAGLRPGVSLDVRVAGGKIEIEPAPEAVRLVRKGRLLVAVRRRPGPRLTAGAVERTRRALEDERGGRT
jgi:AbrB family looped-hinge helix DNA binding protein